jgi:hypothetical protein
MPIEDSITQSSISADLLLKAVVEISKKKKINHVAQETAKQLAILSDAKLCIVSKWNQFENKILFWASHSKNPASSNYNSFLPYSLDDYPKLASVLIDQNSIHYNINDSNINEDDKLLLQGFNSTNLSVFPIFAQEDVIGFVELFHNSIENDLSEDMLKNLQLIANHAGSTLESAIVFWQSRQHTAQLEAVRKASLSLTSSLAIEEVFESILQNSLALSPDAMDSHIFLYENEILTFRAAQWANSENRGQWAEPRKDGLTYAVAKSGNVIAIPDMSTDKLFYQTTNWEGAIGGVALFL